MKKLIYILAFALFTSVSLVSCSEEEIKPADLENGGGRELVSDRN